MLPDSDNYFQYYLLLMRCHIHSHSYIFWYRIRRHIFLCQTSNATQTHTHSIKLQLNIIAVSSEGSYIVIKWVTTFTDEFLLESTSHYFDLLKEGNSGTWNVHRSWLPGNNKRKEKLLIQSLLWMEYNYGKMKMLAHYKSWG